MLSTTEICIRYIKISSLTIFLNYTSFFYRIPAVKTKISEALTEEAEQWLGCGMTYTLFECLKEKLTDLLADQPDGTTEVVIDSLDKLKVSGEASKPAVKKEQLTKSQKRRAWEHSDHKGEKPRGYNWVDIVKHLSQTGGKDDSGAIPTNYEG